MSQTSIVEHDIKPYFDLEAFMHMSRETRLGGATLERLAELWEAWLPKLAVREIDTGKIHSGRLAAGRGGRHGG